MEYNIAAIEVIFNMFRLKPLDELFKKTMENDIWSYSKSTTSKWIIDRKIQ